MAAGHAVRGTTRRPGSLADIEAAGAEAVLADPDRVGTVVAALPQVAVVVILLGSAAGPEEELAALHGPRLEALLTKLTDTTVRGVVYEAAGSVPPALLRSGAELTRAFARRTHARAQVLEADPRNAADWVAAGSLAVERALEPR